MLWSRVILVLILSVISVRPELSLEEIEKELEQLSAIQQDTAETTKTEKSSTATESDTEQVKSGPPKELLDKTSEVSKDKIEDLEKSVSDTSAKKDETEPKTTEVGPPAPKPVKPAPPEIPDRDGTAADPVGPRFPIKKPVKPRPPEIPDRDGTGPPEIPDRDGTDSVVDPVGYPYRKLIKPGPPHREIPDRDADETKTSPLKRYLTRPRFEETPAYRRILEAEAYNHRPQMRRTGGDYVFNPPPRPPPRWKEAPVRRTMGGDYGFNPPRPPPRWKEAPVRRTMGGDYGFNPPPVPPQRWKEAPVRRTMGANTNYDFPRPRPHWKEAPYGRTMDLTRAERMAAAAGNWVQETTPVKVPAKIPAPPVPDVGTRTFNGVRQQMNDEDKDDLVRGKSGSTEAERRKRYLMDLLAEKLKRKVNEAQKRGIKVPDKIMDYLWNYESRRGFDAQSAKNRLSD